jgi:hypothetical protein
MFHAKKQRRQELPSVAAGACNIVRQALRAEGRAQPLGVFASWRETNSI